MSNLFSLSTGSTIETPNGRMTVVARSWGIGTTAEEAIAGTVPAEGVCLSSDGRTWVDGWHSVERHGAESDAAVYVERHTRGGCVFHGWADAVSRRIVQTG